MVVGPLFWYFLLLPCKYLQVLFFLIILPTKKLLKCVMIISQYFWYLVVHQIFTSLLVLCATSFVSTIRFCKCMFLIYFRHTTISHLLQNCIDPVPSMRCLIVYYSTCKTSLFQ
jgi:hypothetical protein